ncbi:MAG: dihydrofolate reductase [Halioglobus sp.]
MPLALIYARSDNYCIGCDGALPWELPDEFKHFTATTMGSAVIMGRKTYEDHCCELPGRMNIVITRNKGFPLAPNVAPASSLQDAIGLAEQKHHKSFVIGGAKLLREALPLADTVYESVIHAKIPGDTYVDAFDFRRWSSELIEEHPTDNRHLFAFSVFRHRRPMQ